MSARRGPHWTRRTSICGTAITVALCATLAVLTACASTPVRQATAACTDRRVLVVRNNTRADVDVIALEGPGREKMIGTASPGRHEFSISDVPERVRFVAKRDGMYVVHGGSNGSAARQVEFNVECR